MPEAVTGALAGVLAVAVNVSMGIAPACSHVTNAVHCYAFTNGKRGFGAGNGESRVVRDCHIAERDIAGIGNRTR